MSYLKESWRRLTWLRTRSRFASELDDEMQFHIESRADELEQSGMDRNAALTLAKREFGSRVRISENTSDAWQIRWLEDLLSDLKHASRAFRRNKGFAATAVICLALGIGVNTTIFTLTTSLLFSEPSCRDSSSMIAIWLGGNSGSSIADYEYLRDAGLFEGMAGINPEHEVNWREGDRTSRLHAATVTGDFFTTVDVPFLLGRGIAPRESNTVVLSHRLWQNAFGGDPNILGRKMILDGSIYTVAGVLPHDHRSIIGFGLSPDVFLPVGRDEQYVQFYARMPQGMTIGVARARLLGVEDQLDHIRPKESKRTDMLRVTGVTGFDVLNQQMPGAVTAFFAMLMVVVGLVLLIACANVASLLLARASSRSHELAVRVSLGAGRSRIVRHLIAESLLLAVLGCLAGVAIDIACSKAIDRITLPLPIPVHIVVGPDWRLLWYSLALTFATALVCGLLPALRAVKSDMSGTLKQHEHQVEGVWNMRSGLVAVQVAVSIVLLSTGFLFVHNLLRATSSDPGFDLHHTIWASMRLVPARYNDPEQVRQMALVRTALERLRNMSGVQAAGVTDRVPLNGNCMIGAHVRTDVSPTPTNALYNCTNVGPDYFQAIGMPILRGRGFLPSDRKGSQSVVVVNESFARALFGDKDPVGHTISTDFKDDRTKLIVGVVKDGKYFTLSEQQRLAVYEPYFAHNESETVDLMVHVAGAPNSVVNAIAEELGRLDPTAAVEVKPMDQALGLALLPSRAGAAMLGSIGVLGLVLAAIGLYGVLLYSVSRRIREIGVRVALGATPRQILELVARHCAFVVGVGCVAGLGLYFLASFPLAMFMVGGMSALDPETLVAAVVVLGGVALAASLGPAMLALRVDPMSALRYE